MTWRDFLYFSKGERRGLIVLLCLITIAGILLILNNKQYSVSDSDLRNTSEIKEMSDKTTDSQPATTNTSKSKVSQKSEKSVSDNVSKKSSSAEPHNIKSNKSETETSSSYNTDPDSETNKETVSERVQRLSSLARPSYSRVEKLKDGTVVELNTADTTLLKKIPGIGSSFAKRIVGYRNLLGGFYTVMQLSEVYGIDEEKYNALATWFSADPSHIIKLSVNSLPQDSLRRHPYINYAQAKIISQLRKQKGKLSGWENLQLLDEFTDTDKIKLQHYLSFE